MTEFYIPDLSPRENDKLAMASHFLACEREVIDEVMKIVDTMWECQSIILECTDLADVRYWRRKQVEGVGILNRLAFEKLGLHGPKPVNANLQRMGRLWDQEVDRVHANTKDSGEAAHTARNSTSAHKEEHQHSSPPDQANRLVWLIPIVLSLLAFLPMPYTFYMGLRWVVFGAAGYLIWSELSLGSSKSNGFVMLFAAIGIIFNPILSFELDRSVWMVLNLVSAGTFGAHMARLNQN